MHGADQIAGGDERPRGPDRAGYPTRLTLLAIGVEDVRDLALIGAIEPIRCALAGLAHPHVQRRIREAEGKAAPGPVEMHGGHADIERHAIDRLDARRVQQRIHLREIAGDEPDRSIARGDHVLAFRDRVRVLVDREDMRAAAGHGAAVAARAERAVDMDLARGDGERMQHFVEQHGAVRRSGREGGRSARHFARAFRFSSSSAMKRRTRFSVTLLRVPFSR